MSAAVARALLAVKPRGIVPWGPLLTFGMLVALFVTDLLLQPALADWNQIGLEIGNALPLVLLGFAQTLVVLVRGIDLSVGGTLAVANVLTATWIGASDGRLDLLLVVLLIGLGMGALNGVLVTFMDFQPFVATLATWSVYGGIALWVLPTDGGAPPPRLTSVVTGTIGAVPTTYVILAGILLVWVWLKGTTFGRAIYAIGSDEESANLNGVRIRAVKVTVYALAGLAAAAAGIYLAGQNSTGTPTIGNGLILRSVAVVVIGGTSLLGGRGGVVLTTMAAFVLTLIDDVVSAQNLSVWVGAAADAGLLLVIVGTRSFIELRRSIER
ncbi:MAG TPA: ABC transporter permease [Gaiellaceae bacterium]|jgi:ribose transport system permease protein